MNDRDKIKSIVDDCVGFIKERRLFPLDPYNYFDKGFAAGRVAAVENMTSLAKVLNLVSSGKYKEMKLDARHRTKDFKIVRWLKPDEIDECHQFAVEGPGHHGHSYCTLSEDCGPQFIRALQAAYDAGHARGFHEGHERGRIHG